MWTVGRESKLSFWFDRWSDQGPLRKVMQGPLTREEHQLEVQEVVSDSGWRWDANPWFCLKMLYWVSKQLLLPLLQEAEVSLRGQGHLMVYSAHSVLML